MLCKKHRSSNRNLVVDLLMIIFGLSAWIGTIAMFIELPLLVQVAPEGWNLPSYLTIITEAANIGTVIYSIIRYSCPVSKRVDFILIMLLLSSGAVSSVLVAYLHSYTTIVAGTSHSTMLFIFCFTLAVIGCTSNVLFMPYLSHFLPTYVVSYFIGTGVGGFLASSVALAQGIGGNLDCKNGTTNSSQESLSTDDLVPSFGVKYYFIFVTFVFIASTVSFYLLNYLPICKTEKIEQPCEEQPTDKQEMLVTSSSESTERSSSNNSLNSLPTSVYAYFLIIGAVLCTLGNGLSHSIETFSCLPYGNTAYHLEVTLGNMANPFACFLAFFFSAYSVISISVLSFLCVLSFVYILVTAVLSPDPPYVGTDAGTSIVVLAWIIFMGLFSYVRVSLASVFRKEEGRGLFWCGALQQFGSASGAIIGYFLVNYTNIFVAYDPCPQP